MKFPPNASGDPPSPEELDPAEERRLDLLKLRPDLPMHKAAHVALIEEGWKPWMKAVLRGVKASARPGAKFNRTAMNLFSKALVEAGRLADSVAALLRRLGVGSEEELEHIVAAYRQAQRAEPEDNVEMAVRTLEAHFRTGRGQKEHAQIGARLGYAKGGKDA